MHSSLVNIFALVIICCAQTCVSQRYSYDLPYRRATSHSYAQGLFSVPTSRPRTIGANSINSPLRDAIYTSKRLSYLTDPYSARLNRRFRKTRISKADAENSKFGGAYNQEDDEESTRSLLKKHKFHKHFGSLLSPCVPYGRSADSAVDPTSDLEGQGRFLLGLNLYTAPVFCGYRLGGLGGLGGLGLGGLGLGLHNLGLDAGGLNYGAGALADPLAAPVYPVRTPLANFLRLFAPGILQNSLAATARPSTQLLADAVESLASNYSSVDPIYQSLPVRRPPNRIYYDSAGAPPITPAQLVGGISTTVNGIIQQLTGNLQPVYPSYGR